MWGIYKNYLREWGAGNVYLLAQNTKSKNIASAPFPYYSCSGRGLDQVRPSKTENLHSLYHENLRLQKFNDMITQVLK